MNEDDPHGRARRARSLRALFLVELVAWLCGLTVATSWHGQRGPLPEHVEIIWWVVLAAHATLALLAVTRLVLGRGIITGSLFRDQLGLQALTVLARLLVLCPLMGVVTVLTDAGWHA